MNEDRIFKEDIIGEDNERYSRYFPKENSLDSLLWLRCNIPDIPGGPYWDDKRNQYSIPIKIMNYKINKEALYKKALKLKVDPEHYLNYNILRSQIENLNEILLSENLNFKKRDSFELLLRYPPIRDSPYIHHNIIDKIIFDDEKIN